MSVEAILTVATVVLAVLALIPAERGQDLRIRLGTTVRIVCGSAAALVVYWALLEQVHSLPVLDSLPRPISWLTGWGPASASLFVLLLATGFAWWRYRVQLPVARLPSLASAVGNLLARRRFGEASHLIEAHRATLRKALKGEYWQLALRKRLLPTRGELHLGALRGVKSRMIFSTDGPAAQWLVSWSKRPQDAAHDLVRSVSLTPAFVAEIAALNPYLGLSLLHLESTWLLREFADTYARALLLDPESILYRELRRAENLDLHNVPLVDQREQPLLWALCADAVRSGGPRFLDTFLNFGIEPLRQGRPSFLKDVLNGPLEDYYEDGRWGSPPFATIYLLTVVAPRNAIHPDAALINLFGLRTLVDALLAQLRPTDAVDLAREWPTPSHYLLYETVSLLCDLVLILKKRPDTMRQRIDANGGAQALTLPVHAIQVLGSVMYSCLRSGRLDGRFKGYLLGVWWRAYWEKYQEAWSHSANVLDALARGGSDGTGEMTHRAGLAEAMGHLDFPERTSAAATAVRARFGIPQA